MNASADAFRIAAVQAAPVFLDRAATLARAAERIVAARDGGADIVVFPEVFVPGYPDWVWCIPPGRGGQLAELFGEYLESAVTPAAGHLQPVCAAAAQAGVHVALGITERPDANAATLHNTIAYIGPDGTLRGLHRKLVPTGAERMIWTPGDGSTLDAVDSPFGRIGGLICWENYMPLARYAVWAAGVRIWVAPTWDRGEAWLATLRHTAREGRAVVIGCAAAMHRDDIPDRFAFKALYPPDREWIHPGDSAIVGPDGAFLAGPVHGRQEILIAQVSPARLAGRKWDLDVTGHYARPDVFRLTIDRSARPVVTDTCEPDEPVQPQSPPAAGWRPG